MSWSQPKGRVCDGALSSGNIANSAEDTLPFRCNRIRSISRVVRHSLFDASDDLDLPVTLLAGLDVDIKHPVQPLHPGHRLVALGGRLVQPVFPGRLTPLAATAPLGRHDTHPKLAIGGEHPVKACQICAWFWHQGSQLRNKVQRFEYDV